jgi:uncharacterized protein (DUF1330 family)
MAEKLWMLHIQGPDDVVAAPSKEEADKVAAAFNAHWGEYLTKKRAESVAEGKNPDHWPTINAVVVEWDSTAKAHARSVAQYWPDYAEYAALGATVTEPERDTRTIDMFSEPQ